MNFIMTIEITEMILRTQFFLGVRILRNDLKMCFKKVGNQPGCPFETFCKAIIFGVKQNGLESSVGQAYFC